MKKAYVMLGLPGCGKSYYIKENLGHCSIVSADEIKEELIEVGVSQDEIHERSVKEAELMMYSLAAKNVENICMDGGGINNSYTERIISRLKGVGYFVVLIYFDTPVSVCLERNRTRSRKVPVPEVEIVRKSVKLNECLIRYSGLADKVVRVAHYTNKHIFMDMDGTMAAYQHIPFDEYGCINFIEGRYFRNAHPVMPVLEKIEALERNGARIYVLSASPDSICMKEKESWLDEWADCIEPEDRYFIGNKLYKFVMLRNICAKLKLDYKDVTFVDDDHRVITDCHKVGINGVHPSMFLTTDFKYEGK